METEHENTQEIGVPKEVYWPSVGVAFKGGEAVCVYGAWLRKAPPHNRVPTITSRINPEERTPRTTLPHCLPILKRDRCTATW